MDYQKVEGGISERLSKLGLFYVDYNMKMVQALIALRAVRKSIIESKDENDKPVSAVKADVLADATPEATAFAVAQTHVDNINMMIRTLSYPHEN